MTQTVNTPPKSTGLDIAALALALFAAPVGLVLGIIGVRRSKRETGAVNTLSLAATLVGSVLTALGIATIIVAASFVSSAAATAQLTSFCATMGLNQATLTSAELVDRPMGLEADQVYAESLVPLWQEVVAVAETLEPDAPVEVRNYVKNLAGNATTVQEFNAISWSGDVSSVQSQITIVTDYASSHCG